MLITYHNQHLIVSGSGIIQVSASIFESCISNDGGGGIFSNIQCTHSINSCIFVKCNTTFKGSAVLIQNGNVIFHKCCAYSCVDESGGNFMVYPNGAIIKFINCNTIHCISIKAHGAFFTGKTSTEINDFNATENIIQTVPNSAHANALCLNSATSSSTNFCNFIKCAGQKSVLEFLYCSNLHIYVNYINIIKNIDHYSLISIDSTKSIAITISNSNFIENAGNNYYYLANDCSGTHVYFNNCNFSINKQSLSIVTFDQNCFFNYQNSLNLIQLGNCLFPSFNMVKTCKNQDSLSKNYLFILIFLLI